MISKFIKILIFFTLTQFQNLSYAQEKIAYIDIDKLLNDSIAGKLITKKIENKYKTDLESFKKTESELANEEKEILSQKNILSSDEFNKKVSTFKKKVKDFRDQQKNSRNKINEIKTKSTSILIKNINPLIEDYAKKKSIDIILPKDSILIARSDLEITEIILKLLNDKIKEIKIALLPHREPMLLIDELINIKKLFSATAIVNVKKTSFFVQGHFPGQPVMPGVLIVEAFGQAAAALTAAGIDKSEYENKLVFLMSVEKARFRNPVIPDCKLELNIEAIRSHGRVWKYKGEAFVDGKKMADAQWSATIVDRK